MNDEAFDYFTQVRSTTEGIIHGLQDCLNEVTEELAVDVSVQMNSLEKILSAVKEKEFVVAIVGRTRAGKSTLLNALAEEDVSPVDTITTTAVTLKCSHGNKRRATVFQTQDDYSDPLFVDQHLNVFQEIFSVFGFRPTNRGKVTQKIISFDKIWDYVTHENNKNNKHRVLCVSIETPKILLPEGVSLMDTAGVESHAEEVEAPIRALSLAVADAVIMVYKSTEAIGTSEFMYLIDKFIRPKNQGKVFFLQNNSPHPYKSYDENIAIYNKAVSAQEEALRARFDKLVQADPSTYADIEFNPVIDQANLEEAWMGIRENDPEHKERGGFERFSKQLWNFLMHESANVFKRINITKGDRVAREVYGLLNREKEILHLARDNKAKAVRSLRRETQVISEEIDELAAQLQNKVREKIELEDENFRQWLGTYHDSWKKRINEEKFNIVNNEVKENFLPGIYARLSVTFDVEGSFLNTLKDEVSLALRELAERVKKTALQALEPKEAMSSQYEDSWEISWRPEGEYEVNLGDFKLGVGWLRRLLDWAPFTDSSVDVLRGDIADALGNIGVLVKEKFENLASNETKRLEAAVREKSREFRKQMADLENRLDDINWENDVDYRTRLTKLERTIGRLSSQRDTIQELLFPLLDVEK